ncbi:OadG family transporter subunit [Desulfomarina sp.]
MIIEGVKLMFVGMATVLLFLSLMILLIQFVSFLTRDATARELEAIQKERELQALKRRKKKEAYADNDEDIAVIAAAIAAFEAERFART